MALREWNRTRACDLKSGLRFAFAATFMTLALTACGGGDDSSASITSSTPSVPSASVGNGAAVGAGASTGGAATADSDTKVAAVPGTTTLSWNPPTLNDDGTPLRLTGYRIYWGQQKGYYTNSVTIDNPGLTRYVIEQLTPAKWYFVATALSERGESQFSNEIAMQVL